MKKVSFVLRETKPLLLVIVLSAMFITALDSLVLPTAISLLISKIETNDAQGIIATVAIGLIAFFVIRTALYVWQVTQQKIWQQFAMKLKQLTYRFFFYQGSVSQSEVENILLNDAKILESNLFFASFSFLYCLAFSLISAVYSLMIDFKLALIFIGFSILPVIVPKIFIPLIRKRTKNWSQANEQLLAKQNDYMQARSVFYQLKRRSFIVAKLHGFLNQTEAAFFDMKRISFTSDWVANICSGIAAFVPLGIGGMLILNGTLSLPSLIAIYLASDRIVSPLVNAVGYYAMIEATDPLFTKIQPVLQFETPKDTTVETTGLPIVLNQVSLQLGKKKLFADLSCTIERGDRVLIMGESGTGKSTLLSLLMGQIALDSGVIHYGGQAVGKDQLRTLIGYFPQQPTIFKESVAFNVHLGDERMDIERIKELLRKVKLDYLAKDDQLFNDDPMFCMNLSGGEKARLALVRLLVRRFPVVLLDEISAALDVETARIIHEVVNQECETIVEVAHHGVAEERYNKKIQLS